MPGKGLVSWWLFSQHFHDLRSQTPWNRSSKEEPESAGERAVMMEANVAGVFSWHFQKEEGQFFPPILLSDPFWQKRLKEESLSFLPSICWGTKRGVPSISAFVGVSSSGSTDGRYAPLHFPAPADAGYGGVGQNHRSSSSRHCAASGTAHPWVSFVAAVDYLWQCSGVPSAFFELTGQDFQPSAYL